MKTNRKVFWLALISALVIVLAACGGGGDSSSESSSSNDSAPEPAAEEVVATGDAAHGEELFVSTCLACHGEGGKGIEGLGKDMTTSTFISDLSDQEFLEFIKVGRSVSDPNNTTGVDMPPKGGNPALSDDDIMDIIAYIRTLHE